MKPEENGRGRGPWETVLNSGGLISGTGATLALGFVTWLIAARLYAAAQVGLASGVVSAMMLCVEIGLLGVGSAVIALFPQHRDRPSRLLGTAFTLVGGAALLAAAVFLGLTSRTFHELSAVTASLPYVLLFLTMSVLGTAGALLDQVSVALRRGEQVLVRSLVNGGVRLALTAALPLLIGATSSLAIFSCWVVANGCMCALGFAQVRRALPRVRLSVDLGMARRLLGIGLPNHALTLTDRAPVLIMPIIATEFLSPLATAYWYTAWMMAWVVFIVPRSFGLTLFAEVAEAPASFARRVWRSVWWSLLVGVVVALGVALVAPFILSVLGHSYSSAGTAPLRLLVLAVVPLSFTEAYFAACRGTQRLREAIIVGVMSGIVSISGAAAVAHAHGLASMAVAWLAAQTATGIWAGLRLRSLCGIRRPNGFALAPALRQPRSTESHP